MPLLLSAALGAAAPARSPATAAAWRAGTPVAQPPVRQAAARGFACAATLGRPAANAAAAQEQEQYVDEGERIGEVEWNPQLVNAVSLVGRLAAPLELRPAGASQVAKCRIAVRKGRDDTKPPFWFDLEIWDDLAVSAAAELRKGELIQVLGRLRQSQWTDNATGARRSAVSVSVTSVNRVASSAGGAAIDAGGGAHESQEPLAAPGYYDQTADAAGWRDESQQGQAPGTWEHLVSNFSEYWDNRTGKRSERAPDFKHKDTGKALWLNSAPAELHEQLRTLPPPAARF